MRSKEECDKYNAAFEKGDNVMGRPVHFDAELIESWYPKTFAERVDKILVYLAEHTPHLGQPVQFDYEKAISFLFLDRKELPAIRQSEERPSGDILFEQEYMLSYLKDQGLITCPIPTVPPPVFLSLTPKGYERVEEIQRFTARGRSVLVAMKFGEETRALREAIRKGITDAGYHAVFIDEVQHNDFITPELLKHIRDSRFVVVDLTHRNNGAYFEEGYALGLGKAVIQLCKKNHKLHFDVAQKNTLMWAEEADIPLMLCNRIKATIG